MLSHYFHSIKELLSLVPVCHKFFKRIKAKNLLLNRKKCIKKCFNEDKLKKKKNQKNFLFKESLFQIQMSNTALYSKQLLYTLLYSRSQHLTVLSSPQENKYGWRGLTTNPRTVLICPVSDNFNLLVAKSQIYKQKILQMWVFDKL